MGHRLSKIYTRTGDDGTTGLGDGSHKFSETKDQHDAAVAEYLQRLRQRRNGGR